MRSKEKRDLRLSTSFRIFRNLGHMIFYAVLLLTDSDRFTNMEADAGRPLGARGNRLIGRKAAAFRFGFNSKARSARWINPFKMG